MELKEDHGGYAGIHVPWNDLNNNGTRDAGEQAELNLLGEGTVIAIGGDAGDGVNSSEYYGRWSEAGRSRSSELVGHRWKRRKC